MADETYSAQVLDHLEHPRNAGSMEAPDAVGVQSNPICGDTMKLMLHIEDGRITEARWQTVGCQPALATSSAATELVTGRTIDEIASITAEDILASLGGLPAGKTHASAMAADALRKAVAGYKARQAS
jgi:NifU-like protein involved in Fe-S cluster formation